LRKKKNIMKILNIITSVGGENSNSLKLGNAIIDKLVNANPESTVITRNLVSSPLPHYGETHLKTLFLRQEDEQPEAAYVRELSNKLLEELLQANVLIISLPMYNLGIPSSLKAWIDHVNIIGKTFSYGEHGPEGLVKGKKVFLVISSGGVYSGGPMQAYDFTESYLTTILGFMGMTDITILRVEGTAIPGLKETALQRSIEELAI